MMIMGNLKVVLDQNRDVYDFDLESEDVQKLTSLSGRQMDSISAVFNNELWDRVWILQEVVLSAARYQAVLLFGHRAMDYDTFSKVVRALLEVAFEFCRAAPDNDTW